MFCQSFVLTSLNLFSSRMFRYQPFAHYSSFLHSVFSTKILFKYKCHVNNSRYIPLFTFHTSNKCHSSEDLKGKQTQPLVKMTITTADNKEYEVEGEVGSTVMEAAVRNQHVHEKMEAACEGQLACTTCHVYVEDKVKDFFSETTQEEEDLLDNAPFIRPSSRLSCQLVISENIEGAKFSLPIATSNFSVDKKGKKHG